MAISRPLLFALIGALVLLVGVTAIRFMGSGADDAPDPGATAATTPADGGASATPSVGGDSPALRDLNRTEATGQGGPAPAAKPPKKRSELAGEGIPPRVGRALERRKVVVLFFGAQGHDDRATRKAARALRGENAEVFTESVYRLDDYARVVGALPVTQLPSTIVIDRQRKARVIEGFADNASLRQLVIDAR